MDGAIRLQRLEAVAEAARRYRRAMKQYLAAQTRLLEDGVPAEDLINRNWDGFQRTAEAEDALSATLDTLDGDQGYHAPRREGDP